MRVTKLIILARTEVRVPGFVHYACQWVDSEQALLGWESLLCSLDNGSSVFNVADMKGRPVNYLDFGRVVLAESSRMCTTEHSVCMCDRNLYDAV